MERREALGRSGTHLLQHLKIGLERRCALWRAEKRIESCKCGHHENRDICAARHKTTAGPRAANPNQNQSLMPTSDSSKLVANALLAASSCSCTTASC